MDKIEFNIGVLLDIIFDSMGKKAKKLLADKYIHKDVSIISKWINLHIPPNREDLKQVSEFVFTEAKECQTIFICNEIKKCIKELPLESIDTETSSSLKKLLEIREHKEFLMNALISSIIYNKQYGNSKRAENKNRQQPKKYDMLINQISVEIISGISCVALRLEHLNSFHFSDNNFEKRMKDIRKQAYPAIEKVVDNCYKKLFALQNIETLRQILNSLPVRSEFEPLLVWKAAEAKIDPTYIRFFYSALCKLKSRYDVFLSWLWQVARNDSLSNEEYTFYEEVTKEHIYIIDNTSKIIYGRGILVLCYLGLTYKDIKSSLDILVLSIMGEFDTSNENWISELEKNLIELESFNNKCCKEVDETKKVMACKPSEYDISCEQSEINFQDRYEAVALKAISLRQSGKVAEAVAIFSSFGETFKNIDPAARLYSTAGQMFTTKIDYLGVKYGIFLYKSKNNPKLCNGLKVGDIIIPLDDCNIMNVAEFMQILKNASSNTPVSIKYLRLTDDGKFLQGKLEISNWPSGICFMPI